MCMTSPFPRKEDAPASRASSAIRCQSFKASLRILQAPTAEKIAMFVVHVKTYTVSTPVVAKKLSVEITAITS